MDAPHSPSDTAADRSASFAHLREQMRQRLVAIVIVTALSLVLINWAKPILMPLALAILLHLTLAPAMRVLKQLGVHPNLGAGFIVLSLMSAVVLAIWGLSAPTVTWLERLPESLPRIEARMRELGKPLQMVQEASAQVDRIASSPSLEAMQVEVRGPGLSSLIVASLQTFLISAVMMFVTLYFLLASEGAFLRKLVRVLPSLTDKKRAVEVIRGIEHDVSRFLTTQLMIGIGLGICQACAMALLGMPNPILWGALGALTIWVPYLGSIVATTIVGLAAFTTFDSGVKALIVPMVFWGLTAIEGMIVSPLIMGRRLTLNPVVLIVWLGLWGWMWGLVGALIAVPMLAALKIVCGKLPSLYALGEFLSEADIDLGAHAAPVVATDDGGTIASASESVSAESAPLVTAPRTSAGA